MHQAETLRTERPLAIFEEAATQHINLLPPGVTVPGMALYDRPAYLEFQKSIIRTIASNIDTVHTRFRDQNAIGIIDRPDIGAYVTPAEYEQVLRELGHGHPPLYGRIDKLIYLPSVASENPSLYTRLQATNGARYETSAGDAAAVCSSNLRAIKHHPELDIAWGGNFEQKIRRLAAAILQPELEGEIKLGVPDADAKIYLDLARRKGNLLNTMRIRQGYHKLGDQEFRLRASYGEYDERMHHYFTVKTGEGALRHELQRRITPTEYKLLSQTDAQGSLLKRRHVVLGEADDSGQRRLWYADQYRSPVLPEWHFETTVHDETEADELAVLYGAWRRIHESARSLIA